LLKDFYVGLYIFRLCYIWMPLWVSIVTFEPLNLWPAPDPNWLPYFLLDQ